MSPPADQTYSASDDKENVDPFGQGRHRDTLLLRPAGNMASSEFKTQLQISEAHDHQGTQLYSHLNRKANSPKVCKPGSNPEPIPAKPRRRRYPLQDITALVYPGYVNIHTSASYGDNPNARTPFPGHHQPYQHASSPRHDVEKLKALVLSPKQQATINSTKAKKHIENHPCLETAGDRAKGGAAVQDVSISIRTESEKKNITIKKALIIRRRQLRRATKCIEIHKAKI